MVWFLTSKCKDIGECTRYTCISFISVTYSVKEFPSICILEEEVMGVAHCPLSKEPDHIFTA